MCLQSPVNVMNHPGLRTRHGDPRRFMLLDGVVYDLLDTTDRMVWMYQEELMSLEAWEGISFGLQRLRYEWEIPADVMMPEPHPNWMMPYVSLGTWMSRHGVQAELRYQPIDLTYSDDEEDDWENLEDITDEQMVAAAVQAEEEMADDELIDEILGHEFAEEIDSPPSEDDDVDF